MIGSLAIARTRLSKSPLAQRFLNGAAWSVLGAVGSSGIALIMWVFVARFLGKETYGQFVVVQSTLGMVGVFAGFGIGAAATRYAAELKLRDTARLGHILTLAERSVLVFGLLASSLLLLSSGWIASHVLNEPDLAMPLSIASVAVFFMALDGYQKSVLIGVESMRAFATGTLSGVIVGLPVMLTATSMYGLQGASVALVANALLQASISRYQITQELRKLSIMRNTEGCMSEWPILWRFSLPALLSGALVGPIHWAAQALLANTPSGYTELATLGVAMQWFNLVMFVPNTVGRVVLPILTDHVANQNQHQSRKLLQYAIGINALIAVPLAIIIAISSPYIMSLYGKSFGDDYAPLIIAVITATLVGIQIPVGNLVAALSRMWLGVVMNCGWAIVYLGLAFFLAPRGATGILTALCIGYFAHASWTFWFAHSHTKPSISY